MPVSLSDVKITGVSQDQQIDDLGNVLPATRVSYSIGEFGPYSVLINNGELSAQKVAIEVRTDAQKYVDILNLQF